MFQATTDERGLKTSEDPFSLHDLQPGLPLGLGRIRRRTHGYIRHGTITLSATLNYIDGRFSSTKVEHQALVEWLAFLKKTHHHTPKEIDLHLIVNTHTTHKHPLLREWVAKHPRIHLHFTPTGASWLNLVERFLRQLTDEVAREGSFDSVAELVDAINLHLFHHNRRPTPLRWRAGGQTILAKTTERELPFGMHRLLRVTRHWPADSPVATVHHLPAPGNPFLRDNFEARNQFLKFPAAQDSMAPALGAIPVSHPERLGQWPEARMGDGIGLVCR